MIAALLNMLVFGTLLGVVVWAAASVIRPARLGWAVGTVLFVVTALLPLRPSKDPLALPLEHRGIEQLIAIVWIAGAALLVVREIVGHVALARRRRTWHRDGDLYVGDAAATVGLVHPIIVVPSPDTDEAILRHERAHQAWRDPAWTAVRRILLALAWPNPGLWLAERALRRASEVAADEEAVRGADRDTRLSYAATLLTAARALAPATAFGDAVTLEERIRRLAGAASPRRWRLVLLIIALLLVIAVPQAGVTDDVVRVHVSIRR